MLLGRGGRMGGWEDGRMGGWECPEEILEEGSSIFSYSTVFFCLFVCLFVFSVFLITFFKFFIFERNW